jgi:hypothetical protein
MTVSVSVSRAARLAYSDDGAVTQGSIWSDASLFVGKAGQVSRLSVESAPQSSVRRLPHLFCLRFVMSLHLMTLFTAHPAKLINLLALLLAFPGSWLLHATRRREQRAMASLVAQRQSRPNQEPTLDWATLRMNRFFYRFGFACLGLALLVSWISTRF